MDLGLPGEAHAAVDLEAVAHAPHGGLAGEQAGDRDVRRALGDGHRVHGGTHRPGAHRHVGAQMPDRPEGPDQPPELFPSPGVLPGQVAAAGRRAGLFGPQRPLIPSDPV
jgi:hypothetical protein